jgi:hypothetical protein
MMPRYYFHDGSSDATGVDLANDVSARNLACETFGEQIKDVQLAAPGKTCSLRVTDEDGRAIVALTFLAAI